MLQNTISPRWELIVSYEFGMSEIKNNKRLFEIVQGSVKLDLPNMMKQKMKSVEGLTKGIEVLFKKNKVEYIHGHGRLSSPHEVTVDMNNGSKRTVRTKNIIIATGSEPVSFPGLNVRK
jgi:dihydrolipoamide dehydrogenase